MKHFSELQRELPRPTYQESHSFVVNGRTCEYTIRIASLAEDRVMARMTIKRAGLLIVNQDFLFPAPYSLERCLESLAGMALMLVATYDLLEQQARQENWRPGK